MAQLILFDASAFLGRFHPIVVHLPIGFILIAFLLEWRKKDDKAQRMTAYIWLLSAASAAVASLCGWFLANEGTYANWTLFFHRWLGIVLVVLCIVAWKVRSSDPVNPLYKKLTNGLALGIILITGHLGGNMTHGSDYLIEHAPKPIQSLLGYNQISDSEFQFSDPDSILVYQDMIEPILKKKCMGCHNDQTQNGGLNMSTPELLLAGGDGGKIVVGGDISSEILRRVTLPISSSKFMPTSGTPMTYHEIKLLEWWISEDAKFDAHLTDLEATPSIAATLMQSYDLDLTPRSWIEKKTVAPPDSTIMKGISETGLSVKLLSQDNGWVEAGVPFGSVISQDQLSSLQSASEQITWLNLSNCELTDNDLDQVKTLKHLTRLRIHGNEITSDGIRRLGSLKFLESLNLTDTNVDDEIFDLLPNFPQLKNLYLWQSKVTREGYESGQSAFGSIDINYGVELQ